MPFRLAFRMAFSCFLLAVLSFSVGIADPAAPFTPTDAPNMNGAYSISPTPKANPALFPKSYKDYPHGVEYFEVYSQPITTLYSQVPYPPTHTMKLVRLVQRTRTPVQVWWAPLAPSPLPDDIVQRYSGKGMAIVGFEVDQVRKTPAGDVSVPISGTSCHC